MDNQTLGAIALGIGIIFFIILLFEILTRFKKSPPDVSKVEAKYSPQMGFPAAQREAVAAKSRNQLLVELHTEVDNLTKLEKQKVHHETEPYAFKLEEQNRIHELQLQKQ